MPAPAYTHYLPVTRSESGRVSPVASGWRKLGTSVSAADSGVTEELRVESIESTVRGWGPHAEAIGIVVGELRCSATRFEPACVIPIPAVLAMLGTITQ